MYLIIIVNLITKEEHIFARYKNEDLALECAVELEENNALRPDLTAHLKVEIDYLYL